MHFHWLQHLNYKEITGNLLFLKQRPIFQPVPVEAEYVLNWNRKQFALIVLQFFLPNADVYDRYRLLHDHHTDQGIHLLYHPTHKSLLLLLW